MINGKISASNNFAKGFFTEGYHHEIEFLENIE